MSRGDRSTGRDWLELLCQGLERLGVTVAACRACDGEATLVLAPIETDARSFGAGRGTSSDDAAGLVVRLSRDAGAPSFVTVAGISVRFRGTAEPGGAGQRAIAVLTRLLAGLASRIPDDLESPYLRGLTTMPPQRALAFAFPFCTAERSVSSDGSVRVDEVLIRLTGRCNQTCPFCSAPPPRPDPSVERVERLLDTIDEVAPSATVTYTGGEPTLRRDLPRLVERALGSARTRRDVAVQTNAIGLADQVKTVAFPCSPRLRFFVSLHSLEEATYDRCTGTTGMLSRAVAGIRNLQASGHEVVLSCVANVWTSPGLTRFVEDVAARLPGPPSPAVHFSITLCPEHRPSAIECLVPYSEVAPRLEAAHQRARELGLRPEPLLSASHAAIPACFLGPRARRRQGPLPLLEHQGAIEPRDFEGWRKGPGCRECCSTASCPGVPRAYAARYGLEELTPVRDVER